MNKNARIAAYRLAESALTRSFTASAINRNLSPNDFTPEELSEIVERAYHILKCLQEDAKDLWDES